MAQRDLLNLLTEFQSKLTAKNGGVKFRVEVPDIWEHRLVISKPEIMREIRIQLAELSQPGRRKGQKILSTRASENFSTEEEQTAFLNQQGLEFKDQDLAQLADFFISNLYQNLVKSPPKGYLVKAKKRNGLLVIFVADPKSTPDKESFLVKVGKRGRIFDRLSNAFGIARIALNRQIASKYGKKVNLQSSEVTFEVGHVVAVAQLRAAQVLSAINTKETEVLLGSLQFTGLSDLVKRNEELIKKFDSKITYVKPQSAVANNLASKHDANILKEVRRGIDLAIQEMLGKDWANQPGSNSLIEAILAELIETATKRNAKITGAKPKKDFSSSKAKTKDTPITAKVPIIEQSLKLGDVTSNFALESSSAVNLANLIPMLNQRLPEIVRQNMGQQGRLVNRTGRFAESTQIVDIGSNMVLSYTYMKNPYQVFENHPSRDPRTLIDASIRELAAGIIRQKFTTRRI